MTAPPPPHASTLIDTATLLRIKSLELRAKHVVHGFMTGLNRSPFHGFSVEFTEYREYAPGDDPRYLDWRVVARRDRYYIKRFEDETNLQCLLLLDRSQSMNYGSLGYTKAEFARTLAATLAYFLTTQRDAVGLASFSNELDEFLPPRYRVGHFRRLLGLLEHPLQAAATQFSRPLEQLAERLVKRGLLVLISDMLAPLETLERSLAALTARGQEVLLLQILDPAETDFNFDRAVLFEDMETARQVYVDPSWSRADYLSRFAAHQQALLAICERLGVTYQQFSTANSLELAFPEFLRLRMQARGSRAGRRRG